MPWPSGEMILLETIDAPFSTRDDVADDYAAAIVYGADVDWEKINAAIVERWSKSGLLYVKRKSWKRVERHPHSSRPESADG